MSDYLTGLEVVATLNIEVFELRVLAKKGLLRPFTRSGVPVRDIQEVRNLRNSKEHQLFTLTARLGAFEVGRVITPDRVSGLEREKELDELKVQISRLEDEGIRPMSYEQIKEELFQYSPCKWENFDSPINENKAIQLTRRFHNFIYLKTDVEKLKNSEKVVPSSVPSQASDVAEQHQGDPCEDFVRRLKFSYENDNEITIQVPGREPLICDHGRMGFKGGKDEWKHFIRVIKGQEHYYKYGPSKTGNQTVKAYDANRSRLTEINKKLVQFLAKEYDVEIPQGFKTFERAIEEGPGVQKFKFRIENRVKKSKYKEYSKEALLDEISGFTKQMYMAFNSDDLSKQSKTNEISDSLAVAVAQAKEKGWISNSDLQDILNEDRIWTPQEEKFDPHEDSPQTKSLY